VWTAWVTIEARLVLAGVFAASAVSKGRSPAAFAAFGSAVGMIGGIPRRYVRAASCFLIAAESLLVGGLLTSATAVWALGAAAALLCAFTVALTRAVRAGIEHACHCFGATDQVVGGGHLIRNAALIVVAAGGFAARVGAAPDLVPSGGLGGLAVAALGAVFLAGIFVVWDDLVFLARPSQLSR
jgi:hypothetical protein